MSPSFNYNLKSNDNDFLNFVSIDSFDNVLIVEKDWATLTPARALWVGYYSKSSTVMMNRKKMKSLNLKKSFLMLNLNRRLTFSWCQMETRSLKHQRKGKEASTLGRNSRVSWKMTSLYLSWGSKMRYLSNSKRIRNIISSYSLTIDRLLHLVDFIIYEPNVLLDSP